MKRLISAAVLVVAALIFTSCTEPVIPQGYALIYGVTDYTVFAPLSLTDDDAVSMADLLESKGWDVTLGLNADADLASVTADVAALAAKIQDGDRFLFYFSGHGGPVNVGGGEPLSAETSSDEIIVLHGADSVVGSFMLGNTNADVKSVTLTDDSMAALFRTLPVKSKTVIIDACNSGGFIGDGFTYSTIPADYIKGSTSTVFTPSETFQMYLNYSPTDNDLPDSEYAVLSAAGENEESWESSSVGHGIFTYYFLNTPGYADYNGDGYISLIEAWKFTSSSIDYYFNIASGDYKNPDQHYMPNLSAFPVDPILFAVD